MNFLQQLLCRLGIIIGGRDDEHFVQLGEIDFRLDLGRLKQVSL